MSEDQVHIALIEQRRTGDQLGRILVRLGFVTEGVIRDALGGALGCDSVDLDEVAVDREVMRLIPKELARRHRVLALTICEKTATLTVAMSDPFDVIALDRVRALLERDLHLRPLLAGEAQLDKAIDRLYGSNLSVDGPLREIETGEIDYRSLETVRDGYDHPVVRLVDALLGDAVELGASDIHFEPEPELVRVRYRIDGVLRQIRSLHRSYWSAIAVRLKVMADLNIAEMRAPQDGRMSLGVAGRPVDFRVSSLPTTSGENIVLRVLDRREGILPLEALGLDDAQLATLDLMMGRPQGILLVTGPTGSGKTTTLYSIVNHLNTVQVNIMTLEDPVEYPLEMIRQTAVNDALRLDFANGIRSLMRQDPDIILVGEIRDEGTAEMAFRAALTGHRVLSTLHANSAVGAIPRLLDTGVTPEVMSGNVAGIIGQRLVRKLCVQCKRPRAPSELERRLLGIDGGPDVFPVFQGTGCERCGFTGYAGRLALMELLRFDDELDELIGRRAGARELLKTALAKGYAVMAEDARRRVAQGVTSFDEVSRVLDLTAGIP